jgi:hypothetical protein
MAAASLRYQLQWAQNSCNHGTMFAGLVVTDHYLHLCPILLVSIHLPDAKLAHPCLLLHIQDSKYKDVGHHYACQKVAQIYVVQSIILWISRTVAL